MPNSDEKPSKSDALAKTLDKRTRQFSRDTNQTGCTTRGHRRTHSHKQTDNQPYLDESAATFFNLGRCGKFSSEVRPTLFIDRDSKFTKASKPIILGALHLSRMSAETSSGFFFNFCNCDWMAASIK